MGVQVTVALIQVSGSFFAFHGNLAGYSDLGSVAHAPDESSAFRTEIAIKPRIVRVARDTLGVNQSILFTHVLARHRNGRLSPCQLTPDIGEAG